MKYRKKPIIVDAEQWLGGPPLEGMIYDDLDGYYYVYDLQGYLRVKPGYWILHHSDGVDSLCSDEIFRENYEKVMSR